MGGRGSTFNERIKGIWDLLKELERKSNKIDYTILDLGDHTSEVSLNGDYAHKTKLNNDNYMICNSMKEVDNKVQSSTINQIALLNDKYSNITKSILGDQQVKVRSFKINNIHIKTEKKTPNYTTMACWSKSSNQICLNQRTMNNFDKALDDVKFSQSTKHFMQTDVGTQDKYIITHEFGHFIEDCLITKRLQKTTFTQEERSKEALTITEEICKIAKKKFNATGNDIKQMSRYGYNNAFEWFAELFAKTQLSSDNISLSKAMNEFLEKENKNDKNS